MKRRILCYGDSNTWGWMPGAGTRYDESVRWPKVLQAKLGDEYEVIEMGQNARTTVWDNPVHQEKNGYKNFVATMDCCFPLEMVIIMLGTNDAMEIFGTNGYHIAIGAGNVAKLALTSAFGIDGKAPEVLLVCPTPITEAYKGEPLMNAFYGTGAVERSANVGDYLEDIAKDLGCHYIDAGKIIKASDIDGVHLMPEEHAKMAEAMYEQVKAIIG